MDCLTKPSADSMANVLILCPLAAELDLLLESFQKNSFEVDQERAGHLKVWAINNLGVRFALAGHGKTQFAIQTQFLLSHFKQTKLVVCAGCAGALDSSLRIGDVVVATQTIEHDFRMKFISRPIPSFKGDSNWLEKISKLNPQDFRLAFGAIASGDEDVIDRARADEIKIQTGAMAVAWEGAGGARACKFNSVPFVEIRGVTDSADSQSMVDFETKLRTAMANVYSILLRSLSI